MSLRSREPNSMATILNFENRDAQSDWSTIWSTSDIPGMDNAAGSNSRFRRFGRRRLRVGSLALGAMLTMHCRVAASALASGFFVFITFLTVAVISLASPLRHFEVYLGQWSINGPGRAFRIVPLLDGIGIAMCLSAIFRAITFCTIAAMSATYTLSSVSDDKLPFTYCRDFNLAPYEPILIDMSNMSLRATLEADNYELQEEKQTTVGFAHQAWRNATLSLKRNENMGAVESNDKIEICNETYPPPYPALYSTPAYNYFYVEVVQLSPDYNCDKFNMSLVTFLLIIWLILWLCMIVERLIHKRMVWNNTPLWFIYIPCLWTAVLIIHAASQVTTSKNLAKVFRVDVKELMSAIIDAFEIALYIHSSGIGTELITGKGLNRYASGHIDPSLNSENVWHSGTVLLLSTLNCVSAAMCSAVDANTNSTTVDIYESTLWMFPLYSKCTSIGRYSHLVSSTVFAGLTFSYMAVAYVFLKTALHTIFEYRVKLVFKEQLVVGVLIISCAALSMIFTSGGGLPLLESVECIIVGVATKVICLLEVVAMLYVYRGHDFTSDINVAMEESMCSSRIGYQWQCLPILALILICIKVGILFKVEMPHPFVMLGMIPMVCVIVALPLRAVHNTYSYLRPGATRT